MALALAMSPRNDLCIYAEIHESEGDESDRDSLKSTLSQDQNETLL